jgi:hypothetical protein
MSPPFSYQKSLFFTFQASRQCQHFHPTPFYQHRKPSVTATPFNSSHYTTLKPS